MARWAVAAGRIRGRAHAEWLHIQGVMFASASGDGELKKARWHGTCILPIILCKLNAYAGQGDCQMAGPTNKDRLNRDQP